MLQIAILRANLLEELNSLGTTPCADPWVAEVEEFAHGEGAKSALLGTSLGLLIYSGATFPWSPRTVLGQLAAGFLIHSGEFVQGARGTGSHEPLPAVHLYEPLRVQQEHGGVAGQLTRVSRHRSALRLDHTADVDGEVYLGGAVPDA